MTEPELTTSIKFQAIGVQVRDVDYGLLLGMTRSAAKAAEDLQRTAEKVLQTLCSLTFTYRDELVVAGDPVAEVGLLEGGVVAHAVPSLGGRGLLRRAMSRMSPKR